MLIRPRTEADLDRLVEILDEVHRLDGYPVRRASRTREFLTPRNELAAWVAEQDASPVGHVALTRGFATPAVVAAIGSAPDDFAGIARLFVAPAARGSGVGRALLDTACAAARAAGLVPVLDVVDTSPAADLYDRLGWRLVGREPATWLADDGTRPVLRYYLAPDHLG